MNAVREKGEAERHRFDHLLEIQRRLGGERDMAVLPGLVMQEVTALLEVDRSSLFLLDWETMELRARFAEGVAADALVVPLRMGIVGSAILTGGVINVTNAYAHPHFNAEIDAVSGFRTHSLMAAPLRAADGRILGGIELLNKATGRFVDPDEKAVRACAEGLAAVAAQGRLDASVAEREMTALRLQVGCERGTLFMVDEPAGRLRALYAEGAGNEPISLSLKLGIAGLVAVTKRTLLIPDVAVDPRFDPSFDQRTGYATRSILCVPLLSPAGEALGVIQAINKKAGAFDDDDVRTLESIAGIVAIAIENAMLLSSQDRQFHSLVEVLAASIDAKDALT
ncbi:MAG TPA: GAF domain-containing protein, partial [Rhodocyclaceae bacterium]|nr:GAF domain-containing protein [Rhodocyclaceae bacterium]